MDSGDSVSDRGLDQPGLIWKKFLHAEDGESLEASKPIVLTLNSFKTAVGILNESGDFVIVPEYGIEGEYQQELMNFEMVYSCSYFLCSDSKYLQPAVNMHIF